MFLNRTEELAFLERAWQTRRAGLLVLYGRRRVGKTALLREFCRNKRHVFYVGTQTSGPEQLRSLAEAVQDGLKTEGVAFERWEEAFRFLASQSASEPLVLVLDEFPYLLESDPSLASVLQKSWDGRLHESRLLVVLCGSTIAVMERDALGEKSPLYGRRTGQYRVEPLDYQAASLFFPQANPSEKIERYALLGGVPTYLLQFDPSASLWDNVQDSILRRGSFLREEVPFLLMGELREPRIYMALLRAMANGSTRLGEIAEKALGPGQSAKAAFYLQTLQHLNWVRRVVPITEAHPHKSRKGLYRITDPFLRFWFRYVLPSESLLEDGREAIVLQRIVDQWSDFVAPVFEDLCRAFLRRATLPFVPERVGSWWSAQGEIDAVGLADHDVLVGECKWSTRRVGIDLLEGLDKKAQALSDVVGGRRLHRALFARAGFTPAVRERSKIEGVLLFEPWDLYVSSAR